MSNGLNDNVAPGFTGFSIIELSENVWIVQEENSSSFGGTFKEVVMFCLYRYGIAIEEIDNAINNMLQYKHNAAHFGMWGDFMYSFQYEFFGKRMAS